MKRQGACELESGTVDVTAIGRDETNLRADAESFTRRSSSFDTRKRTAQNGDGDRQAATKLLRAEHSPLQASTSTTFTVRQAHWLRLRRAQMLRELEKNAGD